MDFCIATFCFGKRYYEQCNRLINDMAKLTDPPFLFVVTDGVEHISKFDFVKPINIKDYNQDYLKYENNYYGFDFSVKRYSLMVSLDFGFEKIILVDCDARINHSLFNENDVTQSFSKNSILGQTTYDFNEQINSNSQLGNRLLRYEKEFNFVCNKNELKFMPEDCIQYFNIEKNVFYKLLEDWDRCIEIKYKEGLPNTPAGNIDEICFCALKNNVIVGNNSHKSLNIMYPEHDKWY
jgi:mRNA-degrading endonuclease HigB of HigAB toxin-antitoxin module